MKMKERSAIEALRAGVPNRAAIRLLGTNESDIRDQFLTRLQRCRAASPSQQPSQGLVVAGGFGSGKSHLLGYLQELALQERFVVSLVPISKETPLFDPGKLYVDAIRNAVVPNQNDDVMTAVVSQAAGRRDAWDHLEHWASGAGSGLAPLFAALLYLLPRQGTAPENVATIARFFGGAKIGVAQVKRWLRDAGAAKLFDVKPIKEADLALQRLRFAPRLFAAAGYSGWCVLLDEVELIGRYSPIQRGRSYAELSRWLGLDEDAAMPGIIAICAISDDFTDIVINNRRDDELIPQRLQAKGLDRVARLALLGMQALHNDNQHFLRQPDEALLRRSRDQVARLYGDAYGWTPPPIDLGERLAGKTMRQYIKSWVTAWDIERLFGERQEITTEGLPINYSETPDIEQAPVDDGETEPAS